EKQRVVALARLDGQEAHFQRPGSGIKDFRIGQTVGDGKRRLVVGADHADHALVAEHDKVNVLMMELVNEDAGPRRLVLRAFIHEGAVIETMDLFEFLCRFRSFKKVRTDAQHPERPPNGARARPTRGTTYHGSGHIGASPVNSVRAPQSRGYKSS